MSENNRENILSDRLEYTHISLLSYKTRVLVVGGGRAGYIKAKSLSSKGCKVFVLSEEFINDFNQLINGENVSIIKGKYEQSFIVDKHLVVIAIRDNYTRKKIMEDCSSLYKLYLDCTEFKEGMFVMPVQRKTKNITFSLNSKGGSPKASMFLADIIGKTLSEYDDFINYICSLREEMKSSEEKDKILDFIASEDFKFFFEKKMHKQVLKMFFNN